MTSVRRFDFGRLQKAIPVAGGGVRIPANLTRVGVAEYRDGRGGVTRELRLPEEVYAPASLETLAHAPVTDLHPPVMVDTSNWRQYSVGAVGGKAEARDPYVAGDLIVHEKSTIDRIDTGDRNECSCGYTCDLDQTPGVWNGQPYDVIQRNIRYNHVAIGPTNWGRLGNEVAMRLDGAITDGNAVEPQQRKTGVKQKYNVDGLEFEVEADPAFFQALAKFAGTMGELRSAHDREKARADALDVRLKNAPNVETLVNETVKLRTDATRVLGAEYKFDGKSVRDIKIDMIKKTDAQFDPKDKSEDYITARYDAAMGIIAASISQSANAGTSAPANGASGLEKAFTQFHIDSSQGWKQPLAMHK